jgi:outer membrane protein TolC
VIDAQRTLASAEQSLAQLQSVISEDQVAVFLALGGGWETGPSQNEVAQHLESSTRP